MRKIKKSITLLLAVLMLITAMPLTGCGSKEKDTMTRAEWIVALGKTFGLDEYSKQRPYFKDINEQDEAFKYIQACGDWGILDNEESDKFKPKQIASVEFALETAIAAAGIDLQGQSAVDYAISQGIIADSGYMSVKEKLTVKRAADIATWAQGKFFDRPIEKREIVELVDSVKDFRQETQKINVVNENELKIDKKIAQEIKEGDVFIASGDKYNPGGIAYKVLSVEADGSGDYIVKTVAPSFEELVANLDIATVIVPRIEDAILPEGVSLSSETIPLSFKDRDYSFVNLTQSFHNEKDACVMYLADPQGINCTFNINFTKGTIKLSSSWKDLLGVGENVKISGQESYTATTHKSQFEKSSIIPDKTLFGPDKYDNSAAIEKYKSGEMDLNSLKNALNQNPDQTEKSVAHMENKFSGGYDVTGQLAIKNLYVVPEIKTKNLLGAPVGLEKFSVKVNYDVESSLSIKGELKEELTVATFPMAVGPSGVVVTIEIKIFVNANGELSVKAIVSNQYKIEYSDGNVKKSSSQDSSLTAQLEITVDAGPKVGVTLSFLGQNIVDANISAAFRFKTSLGGKYETKFSENDESITINRKTTCYLNTDAYFPIITLEIGSKKTWANKLKISFSWELVGEKNAIHMPLWEDRSYVVWEDTLTLLKKEETAQEDELQDGKNPEDSGKLEKHFDTNEYLGIEKYYLSLDEGGTATIAIVSIPDGYDVDTVSWVTSDNSVVTVAGGTIHAVGVGSAIITVSTTDGKYSAECAVTVNGQAVEFQPLEEGDA